MVIAQFEHLGVSAGEEGIYAFSRIKMPPEELLRRLATLPDRAGVAAGARRSMSRRRNLTEHEQAG